VNTTPTPSMSRRGRPVVGTWAEVAAGAALVGALAPLLPLLSITPGSSAYLLAPQVAMFPAAAVLWATRRSPARLPRRLAQLAIAVFCGWILLGIAFGLALRYG
jgi:hypothetical protein